MVKNMSIKHKQDLLFISEPWTNLDQVHSSFWTSHKLKNVALNNKGAQISNLWAFCADHLDPVILQTSRQHISLSMVWDQQSIYVSGIYAATNHVLRRGLWFELTSLIQNNPGLWFLVGDYNSVLRAHCNIPFFQVYD